MGAAVLVLGSSAAAQIQSYDVCLSGAQENPPVATTATGHATVTLDLGLRQMTINGTFSGLSGNQTASHLHGGAAIGSNASVIGALTITGGTSGSFSGTVNLGMNPFAAAKSGRTYINIHSSVFPGGELRGQVVQRINEDHPAELGGDPALLDTGGTVGRGPKIGSTSEPFNVSIDCSAASGAGIYYIQLTPDILTTPLSTGFGFLYSTSTPFLTFTGVHAMDVASASPTGITLPLNVSLVGMPFYVQGFCGGISPSGRTSNALFQMVGI